MVSKNLLKLLIINTLMVSVVNHKIIVLLILLAFVKLNLYLYGQITSQKMETENQQTVAAISRFQAIKQKAERLLTLNKVTAKDIEGLDQAERDYIVEICTQTLSELSGAERDSFLEKIALIVTPLTKADIWERNHALISNAISGYMQQYGSMPQKSVIAEQTGLSRPTIAKHFETYKASPEFAAQARQFQFMAPKVLANVFKSALKGDVKAARLYFELVGALNPQANTTVLNEQNNYIQINNTILSQQNLKQLTADQLNQIESIISNKPIQSSRGLSKRTL
jgi:hypothetical protein